MRRIQRKIDPEKVRQHLDDALENGGELIGYELVFKDTSRKDSWFTYSDGTSQEFRRKLRDLSEFV